nr:MAG: hypothetical protein DIU80_16555 [Chloroflexota bacterium]
MSQPAETLVITFFETPVLAVRGSDGTIYLSIRDLCAAIGLNLSSQLRRLRRDADLRDGMQSFRVMTAGGPQEQDFLILEFVVTWISSVNRVRATPIVQERLRYLRLFIIREVYDSIARAAGLPEGQSRNIEDLRDIERFDAAITGIAERQRSLEESQEKARQAWLDHERRIRELEARLAQVGPISNAQRGHIYQLVQIWAQALADREQMPYGRAIATCWNTIKRKYGVAKYEHLPAAQYDDCVRFITQAYARLTGSELTGEQLNFLDVDDVAE